MKKKYLYLIFGILALAALFYVGWLVVFRFNFFRFASPPPEVPTTFPTGSTIDDVNFLTAGSDFMADEIQTFFEKNNSPLATYQETIGEKTFSAAQLTWMASQQRDYGLNPKVLLSILNQKYGLVVPPGEKYSVYMKNLTETLWNNYQEYKAGVRTVPLETGETTLEGINGASFAIDKFLGADAGSTDELSQRLDQWTKEYQKQFSTNPRTMEDVSRDAPVVQPFLTLPFHQPAQNFVKVNSFFDHQAPKSFDDYLLRFDGKGFSASSFNTCLIGVNCYGGHNAIDYSISNRTPIYAAAAGTVVYRYLNKDSSQGTVDSGLIIDHGNGYRTLYWHQDEIFVQEGDTVAQGQQIGLSGNIGKSSGPHLHFGLRRVIGSKDINPYGWASDTVSDPWGDSFWAWQSDSIADDGEAQAQLFFREYWNFDASGYGGSSWWTYTVTDAARSTNWGIWGTYIQTPGKYNVYGYWPKNADNATKVKYKIFHGTTASDVVINQAADGSRFVLLGTYDFPQGNAVVLLNDATGESKKKVYFDAIKWENVAATPTPTPIPPSPVSAGIYDDTYSAITYTGNWVAKNLTGPYQGTDHLSSTYDNTAKLIFTGTQVSLRYSTGTDLGTAEIDIDDVIVTNIDMKSSSAGWQKVWTSPIIPAGNHTITVRNVSSATISVDAFIVYTTSSPPVVNPGNYDDTSSALRYSGSWKQYTVTGAYNNSLHLSQKVGNSINLTFNGNQFGLVYSKLYNRGKLEVRIDNVLADTLDQYNSKTLRQFQWNSPILSSGQHTITLKHASGEIVDIDAILIWQVVPPAPTPTPTPYVPGAGTYDSTSKAIVYSGNWLKYNNSGPQNNTMSYSMGIGDTATFTFNGQQIVWLYSGAQNRGVVEIRIDGIYIDQFNTYSPTRAWQSKWFSPPLTQNIHTISLKHLSGQVFDLDAFIVMAAPVADPYRFDDFDSRIAYKGTWLTYNDAGPLNNTLHYSVNIGESASLTFYGRQIQFVYTGYNNRGVSDIYIDEKKVGTINGYSADRAWQRVWTSPYVSRANHTLKIVHVSGPVTDIDTIIVNQR